MLQCVVWMGPSEFSGSFSSMPNLKVCKVSSLGHTSTSHLLKNHYLRLLFYIANSILFCKNRYWSWFFHQTNWCQFKWAYVSVSKVCKWSFQLPKIDTKTFKNTYYQACFYFAQKSSVDLGLCEYFSGIFNDYIVVGTAVLHFAGLGMHNNHLFESYFLYWKSLGVVLLFSSFFL